MITIKDLKLANGEEETKRIINNFINNMIIHFREELKLTEVEKYIIEWRERILEFILEFDNETIDENFFTFLEFRYGNIEKQKIVDELSFDEMTVKDFCRAYGMMDARKHIAEYIIRNYPDNAEEREFLKEVASNLAYHTTMLGDRRGFVEDTIEKVMENEDNYFSR